MLRTTLIAVALLVPGSALAQSEPVGDRIEVNGMRMYYEVSGEGDPLIVLHGAYMNIPSMGAIIPKLAETHRVYALEFQGHGRTTDIDRPITYPNLADDVAAFMDAVGVEEAAVFGYSMGAGAGLQLAGDADVVTLEHSVALFRLLGGGIMGDMGEPLPPSRLAIMPATSHTAVITQPDLLHTFIEPFLMGETPKGMFDDPSQGGAP